MSAHHFRFMAAYHQHCTHNLIQSISKHITSEEYSRNIHLYFNSIHGTMAHLLGGDQIWYERISSVPTPEILSTIVPIYSLEPPNEIGTAWETRSPDQKVLFDALLTICNNWIQLLSDKDDAWCTATITYTDTQGNSTSLIRAAGLSQVFNHGTHHRGQISAAFSQFNKAKECPSFDIQSMAQRFTEYRPTLTADEKLQQLLDDDFHFQHFDNPEFASQSGNHKYADRLQDLSPKAFQKRREHNAQVLMTLQQEIPPQALSTDALRLRRALFLDNVSIETAAFDLGCHLYPLNSIGYGGVVNNFLETMEWQEDVTIAPHKFLKRLEAFPTQVNQFIELLKYGVSQNRIASKDMLHKVSEQLFESAANPKPVTDLMTKAYPEWKNVENPSCREWSAVSNFNGACCHLEKYIREEYEPHARTNSGCTGMSNNIGKEVYALSLRFHTTTNMSPQEIHDIGLSQVSRIRERYKHEILVPLQYMTKKEAADCNDATFSKTFATFVNHCRNDQSFYYTTADELLNGYRALCTHISTVLPNYFNTFPTSPLEIVSKDAATAPAAYYLAGTPDGNRPGRFYVNISNLKQRPKYEMKSLALHEAIPGHHHQCALALENETVPNFVRFLEDRRYEFCPARRQIYGAYAEGWALYCEALGEEMGLYKTPMDLFGKLSMEMMRAVRLVVDTGIHHKGWKVEKAIVYMMQQTGMHRHEVEAECYRYEAWPGQACAYKIGEVAIWKMRKEAERRLGVDQFDIKGFHDVVLNSGPMPLNVLEEMVKEWVDGLVRDGNGSSSKKRKTSR